MQHLANLPCPFPFGYNFRKIEPLLRVGEKTAIKNGERVSLGNDYVFPLSGLRVSIFTANGGSHRFNLYVYAPFFEPAHIFRHYASECGSVRVYPVRYIGICPNSGEPKTFTVADQFIVYVNGKRVPDRQFTVTRAAKPSQHRARNAGKQTLGRATAAIFTYPITL